jgi:hypothetical protein
MATSSGTTVFEKTFTIDEIIEESYERIGLVNNTGNQMKAARRSLNIMFQEWGNRGLHYWEVAQNSISQWCKVKLFIQFIDQVQMVLLMVLLVI